MEKLTSRIVALVSGAIAGLFAHFGLALSPEIMEMAGTVTVVVVTAVAAFVALWVDKLLSVLEAKFGK
jgi:5-carboxymethyl-2-hydroxymuconate isomerase